MNKFLLVFAVCVVGFCQDLNFYTFKSDFIQIIKNQDSKIEYSGNFILDQKKALWKYEKPNKKDIYFFNGRVVIVDFELEQVINSKVNNIPNFSKILKSAIKKSENLYEAKFDGTNYEIYFENSLPKTIEYTDKMDNLVQINLTNQEANFKIENDEIFIPKVPKNFDIIDE